ncbi:MAG: hypothetical protein KKI02_02135 [Planctomycetes bacterium]|nr:hypothetical protein [Planctomycetota bacterium]
MKAPYASFRIFSLMLIAVVLFVTPASSMAIEKWVAVAPGMGLAAPQGAQVIVHHADDNGLDLTVGITGLQLSLHKTPSGESLRVSWPDAARCGKSGGPALPVVRKLFIAPPGATVSLDVDAGLASIIDLSAEGFAAPVTPTQSRAAGSPDETAPVPFEHDEASYGIDDALPAQRAAITELGVMRDRHLYLLEVRPVAYNPVRGTLTVWPRIDANIGFEGGCAPDRGPGPMLPRNGVLLNPPDHTDLRGGPGNYLIIVPIDYAGTAPVTQFASAKTAEGHNVLTHTVAAGTSAAAIKAYIVGLWGTADAPDYVLLAADTAGQTSTSNTLPYFIGGGNRNAVTDLPYACMDGGGDWYPDLAIGRFPAASLTELQTMVDKTLLVAGDVFSSPDYTLHAAFIAGPDADCGDEDAHDWVIENYLDSRGFTSDRLYTSDGADTNDMYDSFNAGCVYVVYFGHSSYNHWWHPSFDVNDVRNLVNDGLYSFVYSFTCYTGAFWEATECMGEAWLRVPNAGGAAYIGSSALIYAPGGEWEETVSLEKDAFISIYDDGIREVGPAWQGAIVRLIAEYGPTEPACRDYAECFNLLGDPSLAIPEPPSFTIQADPTFQNICLPPDTQAVFTVQVDPEPGFSDPVTLSTSGLPGGAQSNFSVNHAVPPFTSVLTITNLSPGDFHVGIRGSGGDASELTYVDLLVSSDTPGWVLLLEPNGDIDVSLTPTLVWQEADQAPEYDLEIATDPGFSNVVYSASTSDTSHTVADPLGELTLHYWRVRGVNACGPGDFYLTYSFTTWGEPEYFTEEFDGEAFDLEWYSVAFVPDESGHFYAMCGWPIGGLPTYPGGGTTVNPGNDGYVAIIPSSPVALYGESYNTIYLNANGNLTFTSYDGSYNETLALHMGMPRIAGVYDDLNPLWGGTVSWKETADRVAVTFDDIQGYGFDETVTFQIEMFFDGEIHITWLDVDSDDCIAGLSAGNGIPPDYQESDLSAAERCEPDCHGDLDQDGIIGLGDLAELLGHYNDSGPFGYYDGDLDGDGDVDLSDLAELLGVYGDLCP